MSTETALKPIWVKRVQMLLLVVLCVYFAHLVAQLVWFVAEPEQGNTIQYAAIGKPVAGATSQSSGSLRPIQNYSLFGKPGAKVEKRETTVTATPTRLRLKLKGVFTAEFDGQSGAIIEELGKSTDYYRLGDKVAGQATLEEVYRDRVILNRSGKRESLSFEDGPSGQSRVAEVKKVSKPKKRKPGEINSPEQFIEEATRQLAENPKKALASVGLAVGEQGGYVYKGNNPLLAGLNLKKGDVLLSVNGHTLGDLQQDQDMMQSLYEQGSVDVEVVRDGASFYINYPLR